MHYGVGSSKQTLEDGEGTFELTVLKPLLPRAVVLFAAGAGGAPERHMPLLEAVSACGATVVAPSFSRLTNAIPTAAELAARTERMQAALDALGETCLPIAGLGHSIGTVVLLISAGATACTFAGEVIHAPLDRSVHKLALMAPPGQFFSAPEALDGVEAQVAIWAGGVDEITPPSQATFIQQAIKAERPVDLHIAEGAGHFSFMDLPPPHVTDPLENREAFLGDLARQVASFLVG